MKPNMFIPGARAFVLAAAVTLAGLTAAQAQTNWTNLVSDIPGVAHYPDANLLNPIGLFPMPGGTIVAVNKGTGSLSVYNATHILGTSKFAAPESIVLGSSTSTPTGVAFNAKAYLTASSTSSFVVSGTASQLLVATDNGAVYGVNLSGSTATASPYSNPGAVYKGLALSGTGGGEGQLLYLANFTGGTVDVVNESWGAVTLSPTTAITFSSGSNPAIAAGCVPFNVKAFSIKKGKTTFPYVFVTYTQPASPGSADDLRGAGAAGDGYVLAFDPEGNYKGTIATAGTSEAVAGVKTTGTGESVVSSPYGMAMLHDGHGTATLYVGNVADGTIQTFDLTADDEGNITSTPGGPLVDVEGNTFQIDNLWSLHFGPVPQSWDAFVLGSNELVEDTGALFFTAGIGGEEHGLLGKITSEEIIKLPKLYKFGPVK